MKQFILGLTGPIAAGKSTAAQKLARPGVLIIEVDKIGHKVIEPKSKAWRRLVKHFGKEILNRNRKINRKKLATRVFNSPQELKFLNRVTHPQILKEVKKIIRSKKSGTIVINAALLKQIGLDKLCDQIRVIMAPKKERVKRLLKKGLSVPEIKARMRAQPSDRDYYSFQKSSILPLI